MDVQTTFDITPEYQRRAVRAATGPVGLGIALTGGSFLLLAWLLGSYTLAALGAVYLGLGPLIGFKRRRALRRVQGTVLVSLTDADLQLSGAHSASRQDWSTLGSVYCRRGFWILRYGAARVALPLSVFSPAQIVEVEAFFRARGLLRGRGAVIG